jgi:hypothetical protein
VQIFDENNKELHFYRNFKALDNGTGQMTLTIRDDSDKAVAATHRENVKRLFNPAGGVILVTWTGQREVIAATTAGKARFVLQSDTDSSHAERTFPASVPAGMSLGYAWEGDDALVIETRTAPIAAPIDTAPYSGAPTAPVAEQTAIEQLSDADIKTRLAEAGKYPKKYNRFDAINTLKQLQPVGA